MYYSATTDDAVTLEPETAQPVNAMPKADRQRFGTRRPFSPVPGLPEHFALNAQALVTSLWVAFRAARRLNRQLKRRIRSLASEAGTTDCPQCAAIRHHDGDLCDLCVLSFYARQFLGGPDSEAVSLGQAADEIKLFMEHFDIRDRVDRVESCLLSVRELELKDRAAY